MELELETRTCPVCKKKFRVSPASKQKYDTKLCTQFKGGKLKEITREQLLKIQRNGYRKGIEDQNE